MKAVITFLFALGLASGCELFPQFADDEPSPATRRCQARRIGLSESGRVGFLAGNSAAPPDCALDDEGQVTLEYDVPETCASPEPYRGCVVAIHQNVSRFIGGEGLFEVELCVDGEIDGAINIWLQDRKYDEQLDPKLRLNLEMVAQGEPFASTCRRKWFRADDIGLSPQCLASMPSDAGPCANTTPEADGDATAAAGAGDSSAFEDTRIQLMAEWCDDSKVDGQTRHVKVTLASLTYFPPECLCTEDRDCTGQGVCQGDYWPETACCRCDSQCPGLCSNDIQQ